MKWEHVSQVMHRGLLYSRVALSVGWVCIRICAPTRMMCVHTCVSHLQRKEREIHTPKFQLWVLGSQMMLSCPSIFPVFIRLSTKVICWLYIQKGKEIVKTSAGVQSMQNSLRGLG